MPYAFEQQEALDTSARRIASEELGSALERLLDTNGDLDERVHDVRKSLKKLRALLRLLREPLGESTFQRENVCFRDLGRRLSLARDAAASLESFAKLLAHYSLEPGEFSAVKSALEERRGHGSQHTLDSSLLNETSHGLRLAAARISGWPLGSPEWSGIGSGFRRIYAQGRRAFELAYQKPTPEHFHEWRKRVKDHLYHMRLLSNVWPDPIKGQRDAIEQLADLLGDDHDLVGLRRVIAEELTGSDAERTDLTSFIDQRQRELREQARFIGERVYAEPPRAIAERFSIYYTAWRGEAPLPPCGP